jgi:alpha-1,2-mannosyltransferase
MNTAARALRSIPIANGRLLTRGRVLLVFILALGVVVRSLALDGPWDETLGYDEGVHFGAAELLLSGHVPYRDFLFVQPPGIVVLLQPAALLGRAAGEDVAWALARAAFVGLGALNIGLVWALLRRYGASAAAGGAAFYGVWSATVFTERMLLLEPLLNCALLSALLLLRRRATRPTILAGVALGLACALKLWPAVFVLVVTVWLQQTAGARRAALFVSGAAGGFALVVLPFLALAGWDLIDQVFVAQAERPRDVSLLDRLRYLDGLGDHQRFAPDVVVVGLAVAFLTLAGTLARRQAELRLWFVLLLAGSLTLGLAPSFYDNYSAFIAVPIAGFAGVAFGLLWDRVPRPLARTALLVSVSLTLGAMAFVSATSGRVLQVPGEAEQAEKALTSKEGCLWTSARSPAALLIALDRFSEQIPCGFTLDPFGAALVRDGQKTFSGELDEIARSDLARADGAILLGGPRDQGWSSHTVAFFAAHFRGETYLTSGLTLWRRIERDHPFVGASGGASTAAE